MTNTEKAINQMEAWARDDSHGYDQIYRWGQRGDFDCSAAVIQAWENAGVPVKSNGASYTGNMYTVFIRCGFKDVTSKVNLATGAGLIRGDVLLNAGAHTAMYCGDGKEVEASINEFGGIYGGQPGDQTGKEFLIRSYRNYPWNFVLRFPEAKPAVAYKFKTQKIQYKDRGLDVFRLQVIMRARGYYKGKCSSIFNKQLVTGVKKWQKKAGLSANGVFDNTDDWPTLFGLERDGGAWVVDECKIGMENSKSVLLLQEMLKGLPAAYYTGKLDWNFSSDVKTGLINFCIAANKATGAKLRTDGVFDAAIARYMIG